jgi:spermidine synthase
MLFLDGELQSASADEHIYHESLVHPVMSVTAATASRVLVVGGGEGATVREVLKWGALRVDWVDIDDELVRLCRKHLRWDTVSSPDDARADCTVFTHSAVHYQSADIRDALPTFGQFDVIILDLPDPDGETGYLYSPEFWADLVNHLAPSGKIVTHCGPVRPFGSIGEGYKRMPLTLVSGTSTLNRTFYAQTIPSFQGEWGFMVYGDSSRSLENPTPLPPGLRVVDSAQLRTWFGGGSLLWRNATQ